MAEAKAIAYYARYAPRKVCIVLDQIRGKNVGEAIKILEFIPKRSRVLIQKTLNSAFNNLSNKLGRKLEPGEAWIESCLANAGPVLKRMRPGSMGRAFPFKRKTVHLTIEVTDEKFKK
ncbi:50S ribosomal protein L22 [Elusimicrobiota bacterium]